jgi:hypothetical protein
LAAASVVPSAGCGGVSERTFRDEQARSRRYRDAYETANDELLQARARLSGLRADCAASSTSMAGRDGR